MIGNEIIPSWFSRLKNILHLEPKTLLELIRLLRDAQIRALIDSDTLAMIEGVILLAQIKVRDIMHPKKHMTCIAKKASFEEIMAIVSESGHSRFPVTEEDNGDIIGILHAKDLLGESSEKIDIEDLMREAQYVPESKRLDLLLRELRFNRNHMAIVVDEYGHTSGFITLEDIIEQVTGKIEDEFDIDEEHSIRRHENGQYMIKGDTSIDEFNQMLHTDFNEDTYDTMSGIIMAELGHLPQCGESINLKSFEFKIINADARCIKLLECIDLR